MNTTTKPGDTARRVPPSRAGFTLVEVVIAMVILAVGVLGLGGTTAYIVRQVTLADITTERAAAVQSVLERIQAMDYDSVASGSDSFGGYASSWTSVNETGASKIVTVVTTGPGLAGDTTGFPSISPSVTDTFEFRVISR